MSRRTPSSTDTNDEQYHDPEQVEDIYIVMFPDLEMPYHVPESWMQLVRTEGEAEVWSRRRR